MGCLPLLSPFSPVGDRVVGNSGAGPGWPRGEDTAMRLKQLWWSGLVAAVVGGLVGGTAVAAAGEQFLPLLGVREGALRSVGSPLANGFIDYVTLLNARDGGINGVPLVWEECETVYDVERG